MGAGQRPPQENLASKLHISQGAVSKIERQSDMYISTLRRCLSAMGGELQIIARLPDRDIRITQFEDIIKEKTGTEKS